MAELTPDIVTKVVETCKSNADEAAEALGRGLDAPGGSLRVGEPGTIQMQSLPEGFDGPGLVVVLAVGASAALVVVPESTGLLPDWCAEPDPTGESKLTTLAQELGMILLPEDLMPEDFKAAWVKSLSGALARGGVADDGTIVPLEFSQEAKKGTISLVWPASKPAAVIGAGGAKPEAKPEPKPKPAAKPKLATPTPPQKSVAAPASHRAATVRNLPCFTRSLLRIRVPVVVTLAQKRQPLDRIVELGPGSIIQFDKSCEEMLDLDVGQQRIASGEAVKVGDKFGLRITSIVLPDERFTSVRPAVGGRR